MDAGSAIVLVITGYLLCAVSPLIYRIADKLAQKVKAM